MTGNVALDISIGLVFTYLLYSLYATVLMELVASSLGLRARNLDYALKRMLKDEKNFNSTGAEWWARLKTNLFQIWGRAANLEYDDLYMSFIKQPAIRYLNSGGLAARPSYLTAESFSKGIIDSIKSKDDDLSLLASFELGLNNKIAAYPVNDGRLDTLTHIRSLLEDSNGDLVKFKLLIEGWFNETMARSAGWYKRTTQIFLFIIGTFIVVAFDVDTVEIVRKLSKDPKAREQMVNLAESFVNKYSDSADCANNCDSIFVNITKKEILAEIQQARAVLSAEADIGTTIGKFTRKPGGYILTILALSLGAPFWFDLLNKLIKLRSSIAVKPVDDIPGGKDSSPKQTLNRAG